jgi:predicted DCC family thiol-disulfide oxidoreductase YuxK
MESHSLVHDISAIESSISNDGGENLSLADAPWGSKMVMFYDAECGLCSRSVQFVLAHEANATMLFAPLQSKWGQIVLRSLGKQLNDFDSVIVYKSGELLQRSTAVARIAHTLKRPYCWLAVLELLPLFVRDFCYSLVARNRHSLFKKTDSCLILSDETRTRFIG